MFDAKDMLHDQEAFNRDKRDRDLYISDSLDQYEEQFRNDGLSEEEQWQFCYQLWLNEENLPAPNEGDVEDHVVEDQEDDGSTE